LQDQRLPIHESGGVTRDEYEHLGGIKESDRLDGKVAEDILRDVIDEYKYQRKTTEKIQAEIARRSRQWRARKLALVAARCATLV
jgi:hypothetical protein